MDFLNLGKLEHNEKLKLIELAIINYEDELQVNYLQNLKLKKTYTLQQKLEIVNNAILNCLTSPAPFSNNIAFKDLDNNNPAEFEKLTCLKLLLCSKHISYMWKITYPCLYKSYYAHLKKDDSFTIDIFIGKIRELWNEDNDTQFQLFEKLTNLKYKKLKLEDI